MSDFGLKSGNIVTVRYRSGIIEVVNEPAFTFDSTDHLRSYPVCTNLSSSPQPTSVHGVWLNGVALAVFGADGGASGVHAHSGILVEDRCYLAVGNHVACFYLEPFELLWALQVDDATCFGVHFSREHQALTLTANYPSHGSPIAATFSGKRMAKTSSLKDCLCNRAALRPLIST